MGIFCKKCPIHRRGCFKEWKKEWVGLMRRFSQIDCSGKEKPVFKSGVSKVEYGFIVLNYITIYVFLFEEMVRGKILLQEVRSQALGTLQGLL